MTALLAEPTSANIDAAAKTLRAGGLVAMPTETVYGLACDAANAEAVARLYEAKGRPSFNPLIAHVASVDMAAREAQICDIALKLMEAFWPGPLTLVLPRRTDGMVCDLARAGLDTLALRQPNHSVAQQLLSRFGGPLVAPSANRSGHVSPTLADHVMEDLGDRIDMVLDGGPCSAGIESTIVGLTDGTPALLRVGALVTEDIEALLGHSLSVRAHAEAINAPGQLKSHYAPKAALRLNAKAPSEGEGWLGFGPDDHGGSNLSPAADLREAATNLFAMLRMLDTRHDHIAVAAIPQEGLGAAINDRLARAAQRE